MKMNSGYGTNTKGELLALWCMLYFENVLKVIRLMLEGDSKFIIDWFNNDNNLQVLALQPWMEKIRTVWNFYLTKTTSHYRTYNKAAGQISKEELQLDEEGVFFTKITDGLPENYEKVSTR